MTTISAQTASLAADDVFTKLEVNTEKCYPNCMAIFEMANPTASKTSSLELSKLSFDFGKGLSDVQIDVLTYEDVWGSCKVSKYAPENATWGGGNISVTESCVVGQKEKWIPFDQKTLPKGDKIKVRVRAVKTENIDIDWIPSISIDGGTVTQSKWAWWNTSTFWAVNASDFSPADFKDNVSMIITGGTAQAYSNSSTIGDPNILYTASFNAYPFHDSINASLPDAVNNSKTIMNTSGSSPFGTNTLHANDLAVPYQQDGLWETDAAMFNQTGWSIEFWVKPSAGFALNDILMSKFKTAVGAGQWGGWNIQALGDDALKFDYKMADSCGAACRCWQQSSDITMVNTWNYFTWTSSASGEVKVYTNSVLNSTCQVGFPNVAIPDNLALMDSSNNWGVTVGEMEGFIWWKKELSQAEITAHYNGGSPAAGSETGASTVTSYAAIGNASSQVIHIKGNPNTFCRTSTSPAAKFSYAIFGAEGWHWYTGDNTCTDISGLAIANQDVQLYYNWSGNTSDTLESWNITWTEDTTPPSVSFYVDSIAPSLIFDAQDPADLTTVALFNHRMNITWNITDASNHLNVSTIRLFYKTNNTFSDQLSYVNGSYRAPGWSNTNYTKVTADTYLVSVGDAKVYPLTENLEYQSKVRDVEHTYSWNLSNTNQFLKLRLQNVSTEKQYNIFEIMLNSTTATTASVYYCNASYSTGSILTSPFCVQIYTIPNTIVANHTHTVYSWHHVVPFAINITTGKVGAVKVTSTSYFAVRGKATAISVWGVPETTEADTMRISSSNGNTWASQSGTADAHLHQFNGSSTFFYYLCANDTFGSQNCSSVRSDLIDLAGLPPESPQVTIPENSTYSGNITVTWTAAASPNGYPIVGYNVSLLNGDGTFNSTIFTNTSNLTRPWSFTNPEDYQHRVKVEACDNMSQCSFGISEWFTIKDNVVPNILISSPPNATFDTNNVTVLATRSDLSSGSLWYSLNNGTTNTSLTSGVGASVSFTESGQYLLYVWANDSAGNVNVSNVSFYVNIVSDSGSGSPSGGGGSSSSSPQPLYVTASGEASVCREFLQSEGFLVPFTDIRLSYFDAIPLTELYVGQPYLPHPYLAWTQWFIAYRCVPAENLAFDVYAYGIRMWWVLGVVIAAGAILAYRRFK